MPTNSKISKTESGLFWNSAPIRFNKGPNLAVHVLMRENQILSSTLALSDYFVCTGANDTLRAWLESYSLGKPSSFPVFFKGSPFQQKVMQALSEIPFGKTVSYGELAAICGTPKGARAVGNACGKNPFPLLIPCHRVIQSNGTLGGFALDLEIKRRLLSFEKQ